MRAAWLCIVAAVLVPSVARAQDGEIVPIAGDSEAPAPFILPPGKVKIDLAIGINLSSGAVFKGFAFAPDVFVGVIRGFPFQNGGGVCLGGSSGGCPDTYNVFLGTGIAGPLPGFGSGYAIPVGVGGMFDVSRNLSVGGSFDFVNLAGKNGGAGGRTLTLDASWRD